MLLPKQFMPGIQGIFDEEEIEKCMENQELSERLRKTLYYGKHPTTDRPSLPMTEIAVEFFQDAAPRELGRLDMCVASSYGRRACMSPCSMMLGMMYIERLKKRNPEYLRNASSSDMFLISMMMASKYLYDEGVDEEVFNDEWAESANMDLDQLNELERNFLMAIDWNLFVQPEDFWKMLQKMERKIAWDKGREHGSFNYTDLMVLVESGTLLKTMRQVMLEIGKVVAVCSVAYVAGVVTVLGSTASVLYVRQQLPAPEQVSVPLPSWHSLAESVFRAWPLSELDHARSLTSPTTDDNVTEVNSSGRKESQQQQFENDSEMFSTRIPAGQTSKETIFRQHRQHATGFQFPGFLTLVLLKDTVLQFVDGLGTRNSIKREHSNDVKTTDGLDNWDQETNGFDSNADNIEGSDVICSCGCCGQNSGYDKLCYNLTTPLANANNGQNSLAYGHRKSHGSKLKGVRNSGMDSMDCFPDFACQCCCAVTPTREWVRRPTSYHADLMKSNQPLHRIEEPFAGMTFGFGTSPSMAAAAG